MSLPASIPQCHHRKINGVRCGSPAMNRHSLCYFHHQLRQRSAPYRAANHSQPLQLPPLEDANSIQLAIMQVVDAIVGGHIDNKRAALTLYALQTASSNLRNTSFEPLWWKLADVAGPKAEAEAVAGGLAEPRPLHRRRKRSRRQPSRQPLPQPPPAVPTAPDVLRVSLEDTHRQALNQAQAIVREYLGTDDAARTLKLATLKSQFAKFQLKANS